jgi:hypothetical protein
VAFFILQLAKLRMLEFRYDFLDAICIPEKFQEMQMDTDSLYLALAGKTVEDIIRPEMRQHWAAARARDCVQVEFLPDDKFNWFPRTCCDVHARHDRRTPGLFKLEWSGHEMICLASKTYCGYNRDTGGEKVSCKGVNKRALSNPIQHFRNVLQEQKAFYAINPGFRVKDNHMFTYEVTKKALDYFYCKRCVMEDGVTTKYLDI